MTVATFDLRTGIGHPPDPRDYITKRTACRCAPAGAPRPLWTAFLERITDGNAELQGFLQRYLGYCCTGFTSEHVFVFAYGTGANGKSTFINTVAQIFGDYATVADMSTFIASKVEHHPTDLAKLRGARLVVAQETQRGRRWDETKIKALTGGDKITARFMRRDFFDFMPTFKLFIVGNHKPRLGSVNEAMRRRLLLVPFTVQIPPDERDPRLAEKLKAEWPAILRWCIDGAWNGSRSAWRRRLSCSTPRKTISPIRTRCSNGSTTASKTAVSLLSAEPANCSPPGKHGVRPATQGPAASAPFPKPWRIAALPGSATRPASAASKISS